MNIKEFFATLGIKVDEGSWKRANDVLGALEHGMELLHGAVEVAAEVWEAFVASTVEHAVEINKLSQVMGVSTDAAQEWSYAAKRTGVDLTTLERATERLSANILMAEKGTGEATEAFRALGIKTRDAHGKIRPTEEVMMDLSDAMLHMADSGEKTARVQQLLGKGGITVLPILNKGSEAFKALSQNARDLGLIMDQTTIKQGVEASQQWSDLSAVFGSIGVAISSALLPLILAIGRAMLDWWKINGKGVKLHIERFFHVMATGAWLLWKALKPVLWIVSVLIDHIEIFGAIALGVLLSVAYGYAAAGAAAVLSGLSAAAAWALANLPLIGMAALFALLGLLAEDLYTWWEGGDSLIGALWTKLKGFFGDWLTPNDNDGWFIAALKYALNNLIPAIAALWNWFTGIFSMSWKDITEGLKSAWDGAVKWMESAFWSMINKVVEGLNYVLSKIPGLGDTTLSYHTSDEEANALANQFLWAQNALKNFNLAQVATGVQATAQQVAAGAQKTEQTLNATIQIDGAKNPSEVAEQTVNQLEDWWHGKMRAAKGAR